MNRTTTLTAVICALLSSTTFADKFETLAGPRDEVKLCAGETAFVLFVTEMPTVQYTKRGKRPVQFQLGLTRRSEASSYGVATGHAYDAQVERNPSTRQPLALAGPAKVKLMTDGLVSLQVVGGADK